jgi:peptidoglycan hydrolase-like protein with peptidoglycan-binding domain
MLKFGDKGDGVVSLQNLLRRQGYIIPVDGVFGNQTKYAVMDFQKKYKLGVDGIVGGRTMSALANLGPSKENIIVTPPKQTISKPTPTKVNIVNPSGTGGTVVSKPVEKKDDTMMYLILAGLAVFILPKLLKRKR